MAERLTRFANRKPLTLHEKWAIDSEMRQKRPQAIDYDNVDDYLSALFVWAPALKDDANRIEDERKFWEFRHSKEWDKHVERMRNIPDESDFNNVNDYLKALQDWWPEHYNTQEAIDFVVSHWDGPLDSN